MEEQDIFLGALPDDDVLREIVGYGGVRRAPSGDAEVQIRVHWAATRPDGHFGEGCSIVSRWIGCGKLAIVPIGSRWRRRRQVKPPFRPVSTAAAVLVGMETIGCSVPGLNLAHYPFDLEPEARCFRLQLDGDSKKIALVPVMEVVRAVFGCRSGFLRQVFDGLRDPTIMRRRFLFDRSRSWHKGKTVEVYCHSRPTEREAWLAATIVASREFRACHDGVFANIQVAGGLGGGVQRHVETSFPFAKETPVGIAFESRLVEIATGSQTTIASGGLKAPLNRKSTKRLLITRIRAFESESAFAAVTYSWPKVQTRSDLPSSKGRTLFCGSRSIVLVDSIAPSTLRATLRLGAEGADALARTGVVFTSRPRLLGDKSRSKALVDDGSGEARGSTADANAQGDDDVIPVEIEVKDATGTPGAALGDRGKSMIATDKAIRRLVADRGWSADGLSEDLDSRPPLWPISNGTATIHIVEIEVLTNMGPVLVYEAGSVTKDKRALGIVARSGMTPFTDVDLRTIHAKVVDWRAHWLGRRILGGFVVAGLPRPDAWWADSSLYAGKLGVKIDEVVGRAMTP